MTTTPTIQEYEADLLVRSRDQIADGIVAVTLESASGEDLPRWSPGAHIDVIMTDELVRQYSLCSSPSDPQTWRIGVLLDPSSRGGSAFVHDKLHAGAKARVRGPRNHFALQPATRYQFIAGGIGVTPMLPMIEAAEAAGADWQLLYGGRERSSMGFLPELEQHGDRVTVWPQDEKGLLDLQATLSEARDDTLVYCCGPGALLDAVEGALEHFTVECKRSGITLEIGPNDSILDVLRENGVSMLSSCSEGICGTCETAVIEGIPDHRDSVLTDEEKAVNDALMPCVSRSLTERLVLDL
jgi:ferredoxin-NADP reductase